jgi:hypothetical protein
MKMQTSQQQDQKIRKPTIGSLVMSIALIKACCCCRKLMQKLKMTI